MNLRFFSNLSKLYRILVFTTSIGHMFNNFVNVIMIFVLNFQEIKSMLQLRSRKFVTKNEGTKTTQTNWMT
jgi:hypothetical protein